MESEEEIVLEEGEISDDSDNNYTPLERPSNYSATTQGRFPVQKESESEEELSKSSDSDSDSDAKAKKPKKPKIKLKPRARPTQRLKKYDVWSTRAQEDVLAETLISCDVTKKDRSRAVESYDYPGAARYSSNSDNRGRKNNKRTAADRYNKNIRHARRDSSSPENGSQVKGKVRHILPLSVEADSSNEEIAKDIANKLCEEKEDLILKVINVFGKERTLAVFEETRKIEADGGMLIMNQTRRRTPGGVFLFLVRHADNITLEERNKIFLEDKQKDRNKMKQKQKAKFNKMKYKNASEVKSLPELLTSAEILTSRSNRLRDENDIKDVINPPPTPETDHHENSCDGMESTNQITVNEQSEPPVSTVESTRSRLEPYEDDFLDIGCANDMDLF